MPSRSKLGRSRAAVVRDVRLGGLRYLRGGLLLQRQKVDARLRRRDQRHALLRSHGRRVRQLEPEEQPVTPVALRSFVRG